MTIPDFDEETIRRLRRRARLLTIPRFVANLPLAVFDAVMADRALSAEFFARVNQLLREEGVPPVSVQGTITRRRKMSSYGWGHPAEASDAAGAHWEEVNHAVHRVVARVCDEFELRSCPPEEW